MVGNIYIFYDVVLHLFLPCFAVFVVVTMIAIYCFCCFCLYFALVAVFVVLFVIVVFCFCFVAVVDFHVVNGLFFNILMVMTIMVIILSWTRKVQLRWTSRLGEPKNSSEDGEEGKTAKVRGSIGYQNR